jgi:hypothetical protein
MYNENPYLSLDNFTSFKKNNIYLQRKKIKIIVLNTFVFEVLIYALNYNNTKIFGNLLLQGHDLDLISNNFQ